MGNQQGKHRGHNGRYIDWEQAERPSPPGKPYLAPDSADLPDIIKIRWAKPMSDGGAPILGYLVEHRRTGSPHWLRASPNLAEATEFVLTGLEPGWRYQFRVTAENDIGRSDPSELSEPLTVLLQRSAASAPHFNRELHDTIALENETVELTVNILATPAPKIAWYKDGFELFSSRRTKIVNENESSTLIIYQAAIEDEGEIKCTATNRAGHAVTKANLWLEAPPRIRLPRQYEEGLLFEKGEVIRLKVTTAGRPLPTVSWFHNAEQMVTAGRVEITDTEHGSSIKIRDACREDRGEYVVKGNNKIGEDCVSFLVTITDCPGSPGKPQVVMTLGRTVTLSWTAPDDDGGCKIGAYIVEYYRVGWEVWLKAATSRQLTAILSELIEGSEYKFRVKAENPYGVSHPSEESDKIFIPDPKRGILKPDPKLSEVSWLAAPVDGSEKVLTESERDAAKKRRLLEENARRLLDSSGFEEEHGSEEVDSRAVERRRRLEENAHRLLDTPLDVLLREGTPKRNVIEKPPRRKRNDSVRSSSVSPSMPEENESTSPPVPKRRAKHKTASNEGNSLPASPPPSHPTSEPSYRSPFSFEHPSSPFNSPVPSARPKLSFDTYSPSSPGPLSPNLLRDDSITHGSSELMLVLYPEDGKAKSGMELSAQHRSEIEISLAEPAIAPPLSLSAPELGSDEPFEMPPLRNAISSSEILHELTTARLYQDAAEEEFAKNQMRKKSLERRPSLRGEKIERRSSFREANVERSNSFRKRSQKDEPRESESGLNEMAKKIESKIPVRIDGPRLSSEEREQLEFAKVREKLRLKNEAPIKESEVRLRPVNFKQDSSMSSQLSSHEGETGSEHYEGEVEESVEEEEYIEEEEEELNEEDFEDESDEEFLSDLIRRRENQEKPPVPLHSILKRETPKAMEEETYHPRSMVPAHGLVRAAPVIKEVAPPNVKKEAAPPVVKEASNEIPTITLNDEQPEDAMALPVPESKLPKPQKEAQDTKVGSQIPIKLKIPKKSKILDKIGFGRKKGKKKGVENLAENSVIPVTLAVLPKPILKKKSSQKKFERNKETENESPSRASSVERKKVRISEPGDTGLSVPANLDPKLSPLTQARQQRLQRRQQSLDEEEQANKVLIYHYSDIVKEYGAPKKTPPKLYLDIEELEAHAEDPKVSEDVADSETTTAASDAEERGSAPDMSEVDLDLENLAESPVSEEIKESAPVLDTKLDSNPPSPERSPSPCSSTTSSQGLAPEEAVRSMWEYVTDVAIFFFACWLYLFKSEIYVIPVLILLVYRQLQVTVKENYTKVRQAVKKKIPKIVLDKITE